MTDVSAISSRPRIPVWRTAYDAYRLGLCAIFSSGKMFRFFVYGSLLWISVVGLKYYDAFSRTQDIMIGNSGANSSLIVELLVAILFALLIAAVQTPLGIALQRWILLGESPKASYFAYLLTPVGRRYAFVAFLVHAFFLCTSLAQVFIVLLFGYSPLDGVALAAAMEADKALLSSVMLTAVLFSLVASWLSARLTFAFPATACDRQPGSIRQSLAETKGTSARLFFLYAVIFLPLPILYIVMAFAVGITYALRRIVPGQNSAADPGFISGIFQSPEIMVAGGVMAIAVAVLFVAIAAAAARAYQIRVERGLSGIAEVFS